MFSNLPSVMVKFRLLLKFIILLSTLLFCSGCFLFKTHILNRGYFHPRKGFSATIFFDNPLNLVVIPVEIEGTTYRFLFDTGAPNVVSPEIQKKYNFKTIKKGDVRDSQGIIKKSNYVRLEQVRIGEVDFFNTAAIVIDMKTNPVLSCLELDGIIGSNLMRFCSWRIDYNTKSIILTTFPEQLPYSSDFVELDFKTNRQFDVLIELKSANLVVDNLKVDYGFNGAFDIGEDHYKLFSDNNEFVDPVVEIGYIQSGIFGELRRDTTDSAILKSGFIGALELENVEMAGRGKKLIGTKTLGNFVVTINWQKQTIGFERIKPDNETIRNKFGFTIGFHNGKTIVKTVVSKSVAAQLGLEPGMVINSIDDYNFKDLEDFCSYVLRDSRKESRITIQAGTAGNFKTYAIQSSTDNR